MNDSGVDIVTSCMHGQGIRKEDFLFEERRYDCKKEAVQLYSNMVLNKGELAGYTAGKLYRKELLEECQLRVDDNITYGEDEACVWNCYLSASAIYITFEEYYHYNRRENSTMTIREDRDYWKKINVLYKYLYELFDNSDYRHVLLPQLEQHIITVWLLNHVEKIVPNKKILPMYSFPYDQVPYGSKIVIHGAGKVGQSFFYQIKENHYCEIVAWTDKNCRRNGNYEIGSLQDISRLEFDYVILAASLNRVIQDMESDVLMSGIDKGKVIARVAEKNSFYYVL